MLGNNGNARKKTKLFSDVFPYESEFSLLKILSNSQEIPTNDKNIPLQSVRFTIFQTFKILTIPIQNAGMVSILGKWSTQQQLALFECI